MRSRSIRGVSGPGPLRWLGGPLRGPAGLPQGGTPTSPDPNPSRPPLLLGWARRTAAARGAECVCVSIGAAPVTAGPDGPQARALPWHAQADWCRCPPRSGRRGPPKPCTAGRQAPARRGRRSMSGRLADAAGRRGETGRKAGGASRGGGGAGRHCWRHSLSMAPGRRGPEVSGDSGPAGDSELALRLAAPMSAGRGRGVRTGLGGIKWARAGGVGGHGGRGDTFTEGEADGFRWRREWRGDRRGDGGGEETREGGRPGRGGGRGEGNRMRAS